MTTNTNEVSVVEPGVEPSGVLQGVANYLSQTTEAKDETKRHKRPFDAFGESLPRRIVKHK